MQMTCPKCHGDMRAYERNGVTVDQCTDCRGIFLDRGELERLTSAENAWHGAPPPQQQQQQQYQSHQQPHYQQGYSYGGHHHKKKRESFFEELFD
ncbi:MAG TPA: zf-TFIIB domain-containing protein [Candidatus Limnocylindrales bacterium]|nr:zf-TFIIB domain-containing protein [Candidatus Limnocylindrales bacterium]